MKLNVEQPITDLSNMDIKDQEGPLTLKRVMLAALLANDQKPASDQEKFRRYELAKAVNQGGDVTLKAEDVALIKVRIATVFSTLVMGRAWDMLEGQT